MSNETIGIMNDTLRALYERLEAIKTGLRAVVGVIPGWPVPWQTDPGDWTSRDAFVDGMDLASVNSYASACASYASQGDGG